MANTVTMEFYRDRRYTTQEVGDTIDTIVDTPAAFPANVKVTKVRIRVNEGLHSGSGSYRVSPFAVELKSNSNWHRVWDDETAISGSGGDGTVDFGEFDVPSSLQTVFGQYGVKGIHFVQTDKSYALEGNPDLTGTVVFTYEYLFTRCTPPETVSIKNAVTPLETNILTWSDGGAGLNNAVSGYFIQYMDSPDNDTWDGWKEHPTQPTGVVNSFEVNMPADNTYRLYKVWTLGAAGSEWRSETGTESSDSTYRGHAALEGFTDSPLVVGETYVKALHMQELQDRVNTLREFYGLPRYSFNAIVSRETDLKDWTAHVSEIRAAVDEISTAHDAWIAIPVNCPRADVIEQMRAVILAM